MTVRKLKPTTPGQRNKIIGTFEEITTRVPEKSLVVGKKITGGRNNTGKMTVRNIGGGHKKKYRMIRIVRLILLCCIILMVQRLISLLQKDWKLVKQ